MSTPTRVPEAEVDPIFLDRWSPRSFLPDPIPASELASLFEAVRWAPSSLNEQPWNVLYAVSAEDRARFAAPLSDSNRRWAPAAPLLLYLLARRAYARDGRPNAKALFDAGAAWMSLALQARRLGLHAHAMGGFDEERAHALLEVPADRYQIVVAIAVGRIGPATSLPPDLQAREAPTPRRPLAEVAHEARLPR